MATPRENSDRLRIRHVHTHLNCLLPTESTKAVSQSCAKAALVNNIHLELLSENSYNHSTNVHKRYESTRAHLREMKSCKTNCRWPAIKPSPRGKNHFLQNQSPAGQWSHRVRAEKNYSFLQNKLPAGQWSHRVRAEKTTLFCKTNCRPASGHTESAQKKLLFFAKQTAGRQPASAIGISLRLPEIYPIMGRRAPATRVGSRTAGPGGSTRQTRA